MKAWHICRIDWCTRERVPDALYCRDHLTALWRNEASIIESRPAWVQRLPQNAKVFSGRAA